MSSAAQTSSAGSRSRPQARKKANDDASYFGPPGVSTASGTKRHAIDKADGEHRGKRKRVDPAPSLAAANKKDPANDQEQKSSLVEFNKMPINMLYRYLTHFDIVPQVSPSPLSADDPPSPTSLINPPRHASRAPSPPLATPANRPRRESKEQSRRRSSRLLEEEPRSRSAVLADVEEFHSVLAGIAERHFREMSSVGSRDEVDALAGFMSMVRRRRD